MIFENLWKKCKRRHLISLVFRAQSGKILQKIIINNMNIYLFLSGIFILTFILGKAIEKIRVPWIFAALVLGAVTAIYNPFKSLTDSASFELLANLGMYFMLFMIGLDINLKEITFKLYMTKETQVKVTPWDVEGKVDYDKLIKEFGVKYIDDKQREYLRELAKKKGMEEHIFLKRGLFFCQKRFK